MDPSFHHSAFSDKEIIKQKCELSKKYPELEAEVKEAMQPTTYLIGSVFKRLQLTLKKPGLLTPSHSRGGGGGVPPPPRISAAERWKIM